MLHAFSRKKLIEDAMKESEYIPPVVVAEEEEKDIHPFQAQFHPLNPLLPP